MAESISTKKPTGEQMAYQTFELENQILEDSLYKFSEERQDDLFEKRPWEKDPHYFKKVKISAVALIKMIMHACAGGDIEIMGVMQGKIIGDSFIILDAFGLPVDATETRVNAGAEANQYMIDHMENGEKVGRLESICGWYHSHPGYGCWLSGIDCNTQMLYQKHQEPFLAIVIDPKRTMSAGKVELGCFRTFPEKYINKNASSSEDMIPLDKIQDFGVHASTYYKLDHSFFKSKMDSFLINKLWNQYWVQTLTSNLLLSNAGYFTGGLKDFSMKISKYESKMKPKGVFGVGEKKESETKTLCKDSSKVAREISHAVMLDLLKNQLFVQPWQNS